MKLNFKFFFFFNKKKKKMHNTISIYEHTFLIVNTISTYVLIFYT